MNTARHPAATLAEHVMRLEADLVLIGKIVAAIKATPAQRVTWATAGSAAQLAAMTRDIIECFGREIVR